MRVFRTAVMTSCSRPPLSPAVLERPECLRNVSICRAPGVPNAAVSLGWKHGLAAAATRPRIYFGPRSHCFIGGARRPGHRRRGAG